MTKKKSFVPQTNQLVLFTEIIVCNNRVTQQFNVTIQHGKKDTC